MITAPFVSFQCRSQSFIIEKLVDYYTHRCPYLEILDLRAEQHVRRRRASVNRKCLRTPKLNAGVFMSRRKHGIYSKNESEPEKARNGNRESDAALKVFRKRANIIDIKIQKPHTSTQNCTHGSEQRHTIHVLARKPLRYVFPTSIG
jgi:hypothetical protein